MILENTFLSISSMVDALMPFLSYVKPLVLRIDWNSERAITRIAHPILFVAGMRDELVPHHHMKTLHALARASVNRVWHAVPNGTHNDTWLRGGDRYFAALRTFLDSVTATASTCATSSDASESAPMEEGAIPNMLQQPLMHSLHRMQTSSNE